MTSDRIRQIVLRDLGAVCAAFGGSAPELIEREFFGLNLSCGKVIFEGQLELLLLVSELYPGLPPVALATESNLTEQLPLAWNLQTAEDCRLLDALKKIFIPPGPYRKGFGPTGGPLVTYDSEKAALAGWSRLFSGCDSSAQLDLLSNGLFARTHGLVSEKLATQRVFLGGLGSVGSYIAEQLARSGIGKLVLADPDVVEAVNLSRTSYEFKDIGRTKAKALARRLLNISPNLEIEFVTQKLQDVNKTELDKLVRGCDLVVAATDDPNAQRVLNHYSYGNGKPAIFVGLYAGARGGEVIYCIPERTCCFLCATANRRSIPEIQDAGKEPDIDYGTGRLKGEVAIAADIHHVASAGVKLGLCLLLQGSEDAALSRFLDNAITDKFSYLTMSMVPEYWFYPHIFASAAGQYAYQSVWLSPERSGECGVCGSPRSRESHLNMNVSGPSIGDILRAGQQT